METPNQEEFSQEMLTLENARVNLTKKIKQYSMGVIVGAFMIGASVVLLAYHVAVTWRVETLPKSSNSFIGVLLAIFGGFLYTSSARKKKSAQLELTAIEQQLGR